MKRVPNDSASNWNVYRRKNTWCLNAVINGKRRRLSLRTEDKQAALTIAEKLVDSLLNGPSSGNWVFDDAWIAKRIDGARERSKRKGMEFFLTKDDLAKIVLRAGGLCEVTMLPFKSKPSGAKRNPWAPTVDRIDSSLPYSFENCRLVCYAANIAINEWGHGTFDKIVHGYVTAYGLAALKTKIDGS